MILSPLKMDLELGAQCHRYRCDAKRDLAKRLPHVGEDHYRMRKWSSPYLQLFT